jgi:hypothetical protein
MQVVCGVKARHDTQLQILYGQQQHQDRISHVEIWQEDYTEFTAIVKEIWLSRQRQPTSHLHVDRHVMTDQVDSLLPSGGRPALHARAACTLRPMTDIQIVKAEVLQHIAVNGSAHSSRAIETNCSATASQGKRQHVCTAGTRPLEHNHSATTRVVQDQHTPNQQAGAGGQAVLSPEGTANLATSITVINNFCIANASRGCSQAAPLVDCLRGNKYHFWHMQHAPPGPARLHACTCPLMSTYVHL